MPFLKLVGRVLNCLFLLWANLFSRMLIRLNASSLFKCSILFRWTWSSLRGASTISFGREHSCSLVQKCWCWSLIIPVNLWLKCTYIFEHLLFLLFKLLSLMIFDSTESQIIIEELLRCWICYGVCITNSSSGVVLVVTWDWFNIFGLLRWFQ